MSNTIQLNIILDYCPETNAVTNVKVNSENIIKAKTKPKPKVKKEVDSKYDVVREDNKLILSAKLIEQLGVGAGDCVAVMYRPDDTKKLIPIITASELGNKLTKSNTIAFKGKQNKELSDFGSNFMTILLEDNVFKLVDPEKEDVNPDDIILTDDEISIETVESEEFDIDINNL